MRKCIQPPLIIVVLCCLKLTVNGQEIHYSNYHENLFRINPAALNSIENIQLSLNYRNQWPGSTNFVTYDAAVTGNFEDYNSCAAIRIFQDNQNHGGIVNTFFQAEYAYTLKISRNANLTAGLSGGYALEKIDYSRLTFENPGNVSYQGNTKQGFFDFGTGVLLSIHSKSNIGISLEHIINTSISDFTPGINLHYYGRYLVWGNPSYLSIYLEPFAGIRYYNTYQELFYGGRLNYSGIIGGIYLRQNFKGKPEDLSILLGTNYTNLTLIYTYDINLSVSAGNFNEMASHEVTFLYNFEYKNEIKRKGAIKCPKF